MKTIEIKNIEGKILYSYTCENNSISKTLEQASIEHICLNYADLSRKLIENVKLSQLRLTKADFTNSVFNNVTIKDSHLGGANFTYADIKDTSFIDTICYHSNFINSFIKDSKFLSCSLDNALFYHADIINSEFQSRMWGTNFIGTLFDNVNYNNNIIKSTHDVVCIGNIGSRHSCTTVFKTNNGIFVLCGCFFGTLEEFKMRVLIEHKNNSQYKKEYLDMIDYVQKKFKPKFSLKSIFKRNKKVRGLFL